MRKQIKKLLVIVMLQVVSACVMAEDITFTEETAAAYLKLTPPVKVLLYGGYTDGGSIGVSLVDISGKEFHIFEDYSIGSGGELAMNKTNIPISVREQFKDVPNTKGRVFISQGSPTKDRQITPVEEGERIKVAVDCLATAWYNREATPEEQSLFAEHFQQVRRKENPSYTTLKNKIVPPKKRAETEEESREFDDAHMKNIRRFASLFCIASQQNGSLRPRKMTEPTKPEP